MGAAPSTARRRQAEPAHYVTGDFHNHTTCSDGSISMQKLVKKSTDKADTPWGLDWFVQAGHGGNGNRNCTLAEDATLATPAYPLVFAQPTARRCRARTRPGRTPIRPMQPKGRVSGNAPNQIMWRWQSIQEFQYPLLEYLAALKNKPLFIGLESVVAGHEHTSMSVITGQMPASIYNAAAADRPGLHAARQRDGARAVGVLLRPRRHRHEPRQHRRRRRRRQQLGLLGAGQR